MKSGNKAGVKNSLKVAQSGTPVPAKDFSSKKKEAKAAKSGGGSLSYAKKLPTETATSTPVPTAKAWEGSSEDWSKDYATAKRRGMSTSDHEDSARDRIEDVAGERRMKAEETKLNEDSIEGSGHTRGKPAFGNPPKAAHGFGHPTSARDGHLRNSGHSGAHRIGKKK